MTDKDKIEKFLSTKRPQQLPTKTARGYKGTANKKFKPKWVPKSLENKDA